MSFAKPTSLGIIACPGADSFAREIISHLKGIYKGNFDRKVDYISKLYKMSKEETVLELNRIDDMQSHRVSVVGNVDKYRVPSFHIDCRHIQFANGEIKTEIQSSIRGRDVFIVQDVANSEPVQMDDQMCVLSVNDHIMNLLTAIDSARQAGAKKISLVLPIYPYSRQHKKNGREGLSSSMLGRIMEQMGAARIITLDIHSKEIGHCFENLRLENLHASYQILKTALGFVDLLNEDLIVVSPDTGAIDRNKFFANSLRKPLGMLYKERDYSRISHNADDSNISNARLLGDVEGRTVFMADDMLGTGGTLINALKILRDYGASKIICAVSLPIFSENAVDHFDKAYDDGLFNLLIGTNAINIPVKVLRKSWYKSANVSNLFARTISRVYHKRPVSKLYDSSDMIQKMLSKLPKVETPDLFPGHSNQ